MPKHADPNRVIKRRIYVKNEINRLDKEGLNTDRAALVISERLFLSHATILNDYYVNDKQTEGGVSHPANTPPNDRP